MFAVDNGVNMIVHVFLTTVLIVLSTVDTTLGDGVLTPASPSVKSFSNVSALQNSVYFRHLNQFHVSQAIYLLNVVLDVSPYIYI